MRRLHSNIFSLRTAISLGRNKRLLRSAAAVARWQVQCLIYFGRAISFLYTLIKPVLSIFFLSYIQLVFAILLN